MLSVKKSYGCFPFLKLLIIPVLRVAIDLETMQNLKVISFDIVK